MQFANRITKKAVFLSVGQGCLNGTGTELMCGFVLDDENKCLRLVVVSAEASPAGIQLGPSW